MRNQTPAGQCFLTDAFLNRTRVLCCDHGCDRLKRLSWTVSNTRCSPDRRKTSVICPAVQTRPRRRSFWASWRRRSRGGFCPRSSPVKSEGNRRGSAREACPHWPGWSVRYAASPWPSCCRLVSRTREGDSRFSWTLDPLRGSSTISDGSLCFWGAQFSLWTGEKPREKPWSCFIGVAVLCSSFH